MPGQHVHRHSYQDRTYHDQSDAFPLVEVPELQEQSKRNSPYYYPDDTVPRAFDFFHIRILTSGSLISRPSFCGRHSHDWTALPDISFGNRHKRKGRKTISGLIPVRHSSHTTGGMAPPLRTARPDFNSEAWRLSTQS